MGPTKLMGPQHETNSDMMPEHSTLSVLWGDLSPQGAAQSLI